MDMRPFYRFDMLDIRLGRCPASTVWVEADTPEQANERATAAGVHFEAAEINLPGEPFGYQWAPVDGPPPHWIEEGDAVDMRDAATMVVLANGDVYGGTR